MAPSQSAPCYNGMHLEFNASRTLTDSRSCICGRPACQALTKEFRALNGARGAHLKCPTCNEDGSTPAKRKKAKKLERWRAHLALGPTSLAEIGTINSREQGKKTAAGIETRQASAAKSAKAHHKARRAAWHHFHPAATCYIKQNKKSYAGSIDIPKNFVKDKIQIDGNSNASKKQI